MKLNDPFGRKARRDQVAYEALCDSLRRSKVDTEERARKIIRDTRKRALKFIAGAGAVLLFTYLLLPGFLIGVGAVTALAGAWVIAWTIKGERYVNRYIEEELPGGRPESAPGAGD